MSVCCECCVLSGTSLCVGLITRPEDSYRHILCLSVILKLRLVGSPGLLQADAPWGKERKMSLELKKKPLISCLKSATLSPLLLRRVVQLDLEMAQFGTQNWHLCECVITTSYELRR
jgi:hypothetical protein